MTGREWIIYILENHLEDEPIFKDGHLLGFMTISEAAVKFDVGIATVKVWCETGKLNHIIINNSMYIPANSKDPRKTTEEWVNDGQ